MFAQLHHTANGSSTTADQEKLGKNDPRSGEGDLFREEDEKTVFVPVRIGKDISDTDRPSWSPKQRKDMKDALMPHLLSMS